MRWLIVVPVLAACSSSNLGFTGEAEREESASSAIVNGVTASDHPEAVLVDMYMNGQLYAFCSGSLIAPQVVMTAGHCVDGISEWHIKTPYAQNAAATTTTGATYDWKGNTNDQVNPNQHDIGLVFLTQPLSIPVFPTLASAPLPQNSQVINIGRIQNGTLSKTDLYKSAPVTVADGAPAGFAFDYSANDVIQAGDSGGPGEVDGTPPVIVAVNSGAGQGTEVLARVDLLKTWIDQEVIAHGGYASTPGQPTGGSGGAGATGGSGGSGGDPNANGNGGAGGTSGGGGAAGDGNGDGSNGAGGSGESPSPPVRRGSFSSGDVAQGCSATRSRGGPGAALMLAAFALLAAARKKR